MPSWKHMWPMVSFFARFSIAQPAQFDDIFEFGWSSQHFGASKIYRIYEDDVCPQLLKTRTMAMFQQMQPVLQTASEAMATDPQSPVWLGTDLGRARESMYGIPQSLGGQRDLQSAHLTRQFIDLVNQGLHVRPPHILQRPLIFCDSNFIRTMGGDEVVPQGLSEYEGQTMRDMFGSRLDSHWILFVPLAGEWVRTKTRMHNKGAFMELSKTDDANQWLAKPERGHRSRPSFCFNADEAYAWSILPAHSTLGAPIQRPILILCPALFQRPERALDLTPQPVKTELQSLEPQWAPFYHELFHLFVPDALQDYPWPELDTAQLTARVLNEPGFSVQERELWHVTDHAAHGVTQSQAVAQYDQTYANQNPNDVFSFEELKAIRNPENHLWFSIMVALARGPAGQDWSTGQIEDWAQWQLALDYVLDHEPDPGDQQPVHNPPQGQPGGQAQPGAPNPRKRPAQDPPEGQHDPSRPRYGPGADYNQYLNRRDWDLEMNGTETFNLMPPPGLAAF